jgi:hypothetical protein
LNSGSPTDSVAQRASLSRTVCNCVLFICDMVVLLMFYRL